MIKSAVEFIRAARKVATPILSIDTLDQSALVQAAVAGAFPDPVAVLTWDCLRGLTPVTDAGAKALAAAVPDHGDSPTTDPADALRAAARLPAGACLFLLNAHRWLGEREVAQGVANLRDRFKTDRRSLVLLAPSHELPAELSQDVAVFEEPLPTDAEYEALARKLVANANAHRKDKAKVPTPEGAELRNIKIALRGLATFPAEQALVLSMTSAGYDLGELWSRKKLTVEATPGVRFEYGTGIKLEDVIGLDALAGWTRRMSSGPRAPGAILFLDEIEKMTAGAAGDTSGVSQAMQGAFLTWTQERRHRGIMLVGPPGVGKSYVAEAIANSCNIPIIKANLGDAKGSLVGESERNMRILLKTVDSIAGNQLLMVATCNREDVLAPELRDRFNVGTWYVDAPSPEAQAGMWAWYAARPEYAGHPFGPPPTQAHFTGRDIANIVESAYAQGCTLVEAARTSNVPFCVSQPKVLAALRERAHGVFLSAQRPGPYYRPDSDEARRESLGGRMVTLGDEEA